MGLYTIKPWFVRRLRRVEDALVARRVSPDALTFAAVGVSVLTGVTIAAGGLLERPSLWLAVPPLVLVRLSLNALDGSIARRTRRARPFGAALNELGDRVGDAAAIGATGFVVGPALASCAVASSFLASLTGVLAFALTGTRDSGGPMGKADRVALLAVGATAGALAGSALPFTVVVWMILAGGIATAIMRTVRIRRAIERRSVRPELLAEILIPIPDPPVVEEEMLHAVGR
jgi:CDP-diacylglycerol--glycerol-3-phosphate 3-phosphatidyltransferase